MRYAFRRVVVLAVAAGAAAACGPFRRSGPPDPVVIFKNQSSDQADVYAIGSGGEPVRIGTVFAGRTENLRVPQSVLGGAQRVNLIARIFASPRVVSSGAFTLAPGDSMAVTLSSDEKILAVLPPPGQ
jgi:hypothetical protein